MAIVNGTGADETLLGTGDADVISGRAGNDVIRARNGDDIVRGGRGDDEIFGGSGDDQLFGGVGDDVLNGGSGDDELNGGAGDDVLNGGSGDDVLNGGSGDDELRGGSGDDELNGGSGDDVLFGGSGDDELRGGAGDDELNGGTGDDVLVGGAGDDILVGGAGDDELRGGAGDDTFVFAAGAGNDEIVDLRANDTIDITAITSVTDVSQLTISQSGDDVIIELPGGGSISVRGATVDEVIAQIEVACLLRGTMIATPTGEVPVEQLSIGDEVLTVDGVARPIRWIGTRAYAGAFVKAGKKIAPVVFKTGSLGPNMPSRDLYVSPEHAVLVDNVLVPADLLVNGSSIRQVADIDTVEYFHLEFDAPEVIITNGTPTESYVDHGNRRMFANYQEYVALYGETVAPAAEGKRRFYTVHGGEALEAIRRRLAVEARLAA